MAESQTGKWSLKRLLKHTGLESAELPLPALFLLGVAVALVHVSFDYSLGMPGHHGLEFLTAVVFARLVSTQPLAAAMVAAGAASGDVAFAGHMLHSLKAVPLYFLTGLLVDGAWRILGDRCRALPLAALVGAAAYMAKPLSMLAVAGISGMVFGFMRHGAAFPLVTHAAFGAIGAICGALLARAWMGKHKKPDPAA